MYTMERWVKPVKVKGGGEWVAGGETTTKQKVSDINDVCFFSLSYSRVVFFCCLHCVMSLTQGKKKGGGYSCRRLPCVLFGMCATAYVEGMRGEGGNNKESAVTTK